MTVTTLELYRILEKKYGAGEAETLMKFVEAEVKEQVDEKSSLFISKLSELKSDLRIEMRDNKIDTVKWIVGMSIIQSATMIGALIAILKGIGKI